MAGETTSGMLPRDGKAYAIYSLTWSAAEGLTESLPAAWDYPARHDGECNKELELEALYEALNLDRCSQEVLSNPSLLLPEVGSVEARYAFQAGVYIAHHSLPFSLEERTHLTPGGIEGDMGWYDSLKEVAHRESRLIERWHHWVWTDTRGVVQREVSALGASAILSVAAEQLKSSLWSEILGWDIVPPDDGRV